LNESPAENVRRILTEEVDFIAEQMQATGEARHLAVHLTRKRFKRIRALLRLIRDEVGEAVYQQENRFYRDASRLLSPVRDSAVMVDLFNTLVEADHDAEAQTAVIAIWLTERHHLISSDLLDEAGVLTEVAQLMAQAHSRIANLTIPTESASAFLTGMQYIYKQAQIELHHAFDEGQAEQFHNWRKQVKYLWHAVEILHPLQPELAAKLQMELHLLSDGLGEAHDLFVLRELLQLEAPQLTQHDHVHCFLQEVQDKQIAIEQAQRPFAATLFSQTPTEFIAQFNPQP
jgi:CHAD domain-containing protein